MKVKNLKVIAACLLGSAFSLGNFAQDDTNSYVHEQSDGYEWPTDSAVLEKLHQWQDLKFGVLFHWGLYSVPGICESWPLCSEDWVTRPIDNYEEYKRWYWGFSETFNPTNFDPNQWADIMKAAGMKYMIFTTKHHDGFCMYDTKYTDFSIANGAFKNDPRKDVARHVFDAFRQKNFMIGCYFSKPDWHCQWFWNDYYATPNRHHNYNKEQHPDWWKNYVEFTQNQLNELMSNYGSFDILWLDGGWVTGNDINLDGILSSARKTHIGLIAVDRTIGGKNENYQTPERGVPETQLDYPWESCIPLGNDWGWVPNAPYKSAQKVIATLVEIVAKGGCYVLGVGPTPEGIIEQPVVERLEKVGAWLDKNGEAIYNTHITPIYHDGNTWFTANKNGKTLYAIYVLNDGEQLPATISWSGNVPKGKMTLLANGKKVKYRCNGNQVTVTVPKGVAVESLAFRFEVSK